MFKFETLDIWKITVQFGSDIYKVTRKFPKAEQFGLTSQLIRAATSISLNIAEGSSRTSKTDFQRFIQISIGSLFEVVTCLYFAKDQQYISDKEFRSIYDKCEQIAKMLYGFKRYLNN